MAARGELRHDSDFDVIVDFPPAREADAWRLTEDACARHGVRPDILPASLTDPAFIAKILRSRVVILP